MKYQRAFLSQNFIFRIVVVHISNFKKVGLSQIVGN